MDREEKSLLEKFQCDYNRQLEENFAQTLAEKEDVRLFFINSGQPFTDGKNIVVDPSLYGLFTDRAAIERIEDFLGWPKVVLVDAWNVLRILTRAQTIHECLHILYTDFPGEIVNDKKCDTAAKRAAMNMISNIIEDAYIESVGSEYFDNMESYLMFGRLANLFSSMPVESTAEKVFGRVLHEDPMKEHEKTKLDIFLEYIDYMATFLLYPMVKQSEPSKEIAEYVRATKKLFLDGSMAPSPKERYAFSSQIFDRVADLIPDDLKEIDLSPLIAKITGYKTHAFPGSSSGRGGNKGKSQAVSGHLFTDKDGEAKSNGPNISELMSAVSQFAKEKDAVDSMLTYEGAYTAISGSEYDCSVLHKKIKINETRPKINLNLRKAYQNILSLYLMKIRSHNSRFARLLRGHSLQKEEKRLFGTGITSSRLGDPKKRWWHRMVPSDEPIDLAVLFLIDGSGSMQGERQKAAIHSAVILHEVLKRQHIPHAIAEHRARPSDPEIDINILLDFSCRDVEKFNLLEVKANGNSRDGLALFWAERYIDRHTTNEYKLIIVLSDGLPEHYVDDYCPPVSSKDTANSVKKITQRGTHIIGISIDPPDEFACYDTLSEIYPNLVGCNDLSRLPSQVLGIVGKLMCH